MARGPLIIYSSMNSVRTPHQDLGNFCSTYMNIILHLVRWTPFRGVEWMRAGGSGASRVVGIRPIAAESNSLTPEFETAGLRIETRQLPHAPAPAGLKRFLTVELLSRARAPVSMCSRGNHGHSPIECQFAVRPI